MDLRIVRGIEQSSAASSQAVGLRAPAYPLPDFVSRSAADLPNAYANAVAAHPMQIQTNQDVVEISGHQIIKPQHDHVDSFKAGYLPNIFNL